MILDIQAELRYNQIVLIRNPFLDPKWVRVF